MSTTIEITQPTSAVSIEVSIATPGPKGDPFAGGYAVIIDTTNQALVSPTASQAVKLGTSLESDGITLTTNKVIPSENGVYDINWSIQFVNTDNNTIRAAEVWFVVNGAPVADSNSRFDVPGAHNGNGHLIATVSLTISLDAEDELRLFWFASSQTVSIETLPARTNPTRPRTPGVILNVMQIR